MPLRLTAALLAVALLGACGNDDPNSVSNQAKSGSQKNYVAGDGRVQQVPVAQRGQPVQLTGTTVDEVPWSIETTRGKPLVINIWASWCPPCQAEAPALKKVAQDSEFAGKVGFIGMLNRDSAANGKAQLEAWGMPFTSLKDDNGAGLLALQGKGGLGMPSTLVLDAQGRIAAYVAGSVTEATLTGMIEDVLKGSAGA